MTDKLRMAVIGAGRLGGFHAQKLSQRDDVTLVAIADPLAANRQRVAAECHTEACAEYADILDRHRCRRHRRPHQPALRNCGASASRPACTCLSKSHFAFGGLKPNDWLPKQAAARLVLQVGHVERFNPAFQAAAAQITGSEVHRGRPA